MRGQIGRLLCAACAATAGFCEAALARGGSYKPPAEQAAPTGPERARGFAGPRNVSDAPRSSRPVGVHREPQGLYPAPPPYERPRGFSLPRGRDSLPIPGRF